ncbi:putative sucrose-phosphate synthase 1 [Prunus yedoensis var. nudiflora]|uniref:Putative sucrose-phosphate synthase 1 n=1 Tax=Prunus yedoensis var. nudiflora TaxID=2094558 RepID=A0A314Z6L7_PRUYE|nr:putative sucrose-phosphate synthase 1 [Prunus yedoensis var. nudiflora]
MSQIITRGLGVRNRLLLRRLINFQLTTVIAAGGECGDTDYDDCLLGGLHKSVILNGVASTAISQLRTDPNYPLSETDVLAPDSPNIVQIGEGCGSCGWKFE